MSIVSVYSYLVIKYYYSHTVVIRSPGIYLYLLVILIQIVCSDCWWYRRDRIQIRDVSNYPVSCQCFTRYTYPLFYTAYIYSRCTYFVFWISYICARYSKWDNPHSIREYTESSQDSDLHPDKVIFFSSNSFSFSSPRSGSSFTASLLSSVPGVFYVFEPFKFVRVGGVAIETAVARDNSLYSTAQTVLSNIFHCNITNKQIDKLRKR